MLRDFKGILRRMIDFGMMKKEGEVCVCVNLQSV